MSNADQIFSTLIGSANPDQFFKDYWEKAVLLIRRDQPDYYKDLLSLEDIDRLISGSGLRYPALRLVKDGITIPVTKYTADIPWSSQPFSKSILPEMVYKEYGQGATIILEALHRYWPPLAKFCRRLEQFFNFPVQTNIYLTPPSSQGFAPHYDTHDVFVLQLAGSKHWKIYDSPLELPYRDQHYKSTDVQSGELKYSINFKAGDLIYMPRGFIHEALTSDDISLHATIGILSYTWYDVLVEAFKQYKEDPEMRRALPVGFARQMLNEKSNLPLPEAVSSINQPALDKALGTLAKRFLHTRPPFLEGQLSNLNSLQKINPDTQVRVRTEPLYYFETDDENCNLIFDGKKVIFPEYVAPALHFILETGTGTFQIAALPDVLDTAGKLVLVRRLIKEGFLTLVSDA
jgi:ribosomal protein L16 Arg81 hydroxylase